MVTHNHRATEIRFELDGHETAVLDGYCQATGKSRGEVLRDLLAKWSHEQLHVAMLVCRVAGVNPADPDASRRDTGGHVVFGGRG